MARKKTQADKLRLHQPDAVPTWQDKLSLPSSAKKPAVASNIDVEEKPEKIYKTYWLDPEIVRAVKELAQKHRVGINELAEFLLTHTMKAIEEENLEIPVKNSRNTIDR